MTATHDHVTSTTAATEAAMHPQPVPINVYTTGEAMVLVAPLPAVRPADVCVEVRPGAPPTVRFWAHVRSAGPREYLVHEWEYGGYERQLELPDGFGGGLEASLHNGQLAVRVLRGACASPLTVTPS